MSDTDPPPSSHGRQAPATPADHLIPSSVLPGAVVGSVSGATNAGVPHPPTSHLSALRTHTALPGEPLVEHTNHPTGGKQKADGIPDAGFSLPPGLNVAESLQAYLDAADDPLVRT